VSDALALALRDVEKDTLEKLSLKNLIVLDSVLHAEESASAFEYARKRLEALGLSLSKSTFFKSLSFLQSLGVVMLVRKKTSRGFTYDVKTLVSEPEVITEALERQI